jgi:hypothetical protein
MGFPPDGMLGMAFPPIPKLPASPIFEILVNGGKVTEPVFSIKLASDGGELNPSGKNGELYGGEITYTPTTLLIRARNLRLNHQVSGTSVPFS